MASTPPPRRPQNLRKPPPRRRAPQRSGTDPRVVAGAAAAAFLVVLVVLVVLVAGGGGGGDDRTVQAAAREETPAPTATATATPKPDPTPRPLTAEQREVRDQAAQIVTSRGFRVLRLRDFQPRKTLQVLIGRSASGNRLAFFFVDGEYIGNDSTESSAKVVVRPGGDKTSVVLRYTTFTGAEGVGGAPEGEPVDVTFRWDGTRLEPDPAIPDASARVR